MSKRYTTPEQIERHRRESREYYQRNKKRISAFRRTDIEEKKRRSANMRKYRKDNQERFTAYEKAYRNKPEQKTKRAKKNKIWREKNTERVKQSKKMYREENLEHCKEKSKKYRAENREKLNKYSSEKYYENREDVLAEMRERYENDPQFKAEIKVRRHRYRKQNADKIAASNKLRQDRMKSNKTVDPITAERWLEILDYFDYRCAYCQPKRVRLVNNLTMDHVEPVSLGGTNDWFNIVPACRSCNSKKSNRYLLPFLFPLHLRSMIGSRIPTKKKVQRVRFDSIKP